MLVVWNIARKCCVNIDRWCVNRGLNDVIVAASRLLCSFSVRSLVLNHSFIFMAGWSLWAAAAPASHGFFRRAEGNFRHYNLSLNVVTSSLMALGRIRAAPPARCSCFVLLSPHEQNATVICKRRGSIRDVNVDIIRVYTSKLLKQYYGFISGLCCSTSRQQFKKSISTEKDWIFSQ